MSSIDLIIFDLDGTLVDTAPDISSSANYVLEKMNYPQMDMTQVKSAIGKGVHDLLTVLTNGAMSGDVLEEAVGYFREHYKENLVNQSRVYPHVLDVLEGPFKGISKAVATNKPMQLTTIILNRLDLTKYFDPIIGTGVGYAPKPSPECVEAIITHHKVDKDKVFLIGDSQIDYDTAKGVGIRFGWVNYGYDSVDPNGFYDTFNSPLEWKEILNGNV